MSTPSSKIRTSWVWFCTSSTRLRVVSIARQAHAKHAAERGHAVVIARNRDHALVADTALHCQNSIVWDCRKRIQAGLLFDKGLIYNTQGRGVGARIGNARAPQIELRIQIVDIAEHPRQKEVLPDIAEGWFNLAFCLGPVRLTRAWDRAVVVEQSNEGGVVSDNANLIFTDHRRFIRS